MKKNRMMRLASILLVCVLLSTSVISGTFAKYTSDATAFDTARVAKWKITYAGGSNAGVDITGTNETIVFDLFNTVNEADTTASEEHVKKDNTTAIIAPGTGGSFKMTVKNESEVTAKYTIALTETRNDGIFVQYSLDNKAWYDDFSTINSDTNMKDVVLAMENGSKEVTIYWRWVFDKGVDTTGHAGQNDASDTALGVAAAAAASDATMPSVTVTALITATQVD